MLKTMTRSLMFLCVLPFSVRAEQTQMQWVRLGESNYTYTFPVFANQPLEKISPTIERIIFVQHGAKRNADDYFRTMDSVVQPDQRTLVIAPAFLTKTDEQGKGYAGPRWTASSWITGLIPSVDGQGPGTFQVYHDIIHLLQMQHPHAFRQIIFAGHSGGGQFVQRFAVLNQIDEQLRSQGTDVRYLVANPSSYLYTRPVRPVLQKDGSFAFAKPDLASVNCPDWNQYKYGLEQIPGRDIADSNDISKRYLNRHVTYLLGELDTDPQHPLLDKHCAAELQGPYRLARGLGYRAFLQQLAQQTHMAGPFSSGHQFIVIPRTGHDQKKMFSARCVAAILQNRPATENCSADDTPAAQNGD
jgi:hypothetical protein